MAGDEDEYTEIPDLEKEVAEGDHLSVLRALAALAAHELAGNRCKTCKMSVMKMGEISSLMLRLQKIYEEIEDLTGGPKKSDGNPDKPKKGGSLRDIQSVGHLKVVGQSGPEDSGLPLYGTRSASRRQGGRKPRSNKILDES